MSTSVRILIAFLFLLFGGLVYFANDLTERVERQYMEAAEEPMVDAAQVMAAWVETLVRDDGTIDVSPLRETFGRAHQRRFLAKIYNFEKVALSLHLYVTDANGIVLFDSRGKAEGENYRWMLDVGRTLKGEYGARSSRTDEANAFSSVLFVAAPVRRGDAIVGVASVSKPQADMFPFMEETKAHIRWMALSSFVGMALLASVFTNWLASPIRKLTTYVQQLGRKERPPTPKLRGSEARTLGEAFEHLRDKLEGRQYVEGYVRTLTHEMKSPIAAIKGAAELLQEDAMPIEKRTRFLQNIHAETTRMQNVIDRLLALSSVENRKALDDATTLDLSMLANAVADAYGAALEAHAHSLEMSTPADAWVRGESVLLEMALGNLLQNAIDFSPPGGRIWVDVSQSTNGVRLDVCDEGPGVPEYALKKAFDHFYSLQRPDSGKKSSGLGLCLVREIMELHGGMASIHNRSEGGTCARLQFPPIFSDTP